MKILKFNILHLLMIALCLSLGMDSCEEDSISTDIPNQLFRPVYFKTNINGNQVSFSWVPIAGATYSLELSKDSLLFQKELQIIPVSGASEYIVENLWSNMRYSARIKAVSTNSTIKDSEYKQITFKTGTENIFYNVATEDIGTDHVLLKWDNSKDVSQIVVSAPNAANVVISLSSSDKTNGRKLIQNLNSNTTYTFTIYLGEMLRGTISVKTTM